MIPWSPSGNNFIVAFFRYSALFLGQGYAAGVFLMMDPTWLGQLLDEHGPGLTLYARQWCVAPEDAVQEAFLKLVAQKKLPDQVVPWLYRVVRNTAISMIRSAQRQRNYETQAARQQPAWFVAGDHGSLDAETVKVALEKLPTDQREVITLHLWGGLTFAEIAQIVNSSSSTVHRWYLAGMEGLRSALHAAG
jgi:RNA polymerase sigma factor (sigma-70 family)